MDNINQEKRKLLEEFGSIKPILMKLWTMFARTSRFIKPLQLLIWPALLPILSLRRSQSYEIQGYQGGLQQSL